LVKIKHFAFLEFFVLGAIPTEERRHRAMRSLVLRTAPLGRTANIACPNLETFRSYTKNVKESLLRVRVVA